MWYEIKVNDKKVTDVYDEADIIKVSCELVNAYGVNDEDINVIEHN